MTSSKIRSIPYLSVSSRSLFKNSSSTGNPPPPPKMGSSISAARLSLFLFNTSKVLSLFISNDRMPDSLASRSPGGF